jgi:hypothetical protein
MFALPAIARKQYKDLLGKQNLLENESVRSDFNIYLGERQIAWNYFLRSGNLTI